MSILALAFASAFALAQQPAATPCATGNPGCAAQTTVVNTAASVSKQDRKHARQAYEKALEYQREHRDEEAFEAFSEADRLVPHDVNYETGKELARQERIAGHIRKGNQFLDAGKKVEALAEFREAIELDPENEFALQRLHDMVGPGLMGSGLPVLKDSPRVVASAEPVDLQPNPGAQPFHYRGDTRGLITLIAQQFGVALVIDDSVQSRQVKFDVDKADFFTAMQAACDLSKTFWTPLDEKQIVVAQETPENRRAYERMAYRTFYVPDAITPPELNDVSNLMRNMFDIRFVSVQASSSTITVRAPQRTMKAVTTFFEGLDQARPQVLIDVSVYAVDRTFTRKMGLSVPNQFQAFNIPAAALTALGGQNVQDLINQLIASGGINQAGSTALQALLAQQQNQQNSLFSQPVATFGGGKTLTGVTLGTPAATLSMNSSDVTSLEHLTLRAAQGNTASFLLGTRYPIQNAQFAPVFNTSAIAGVIGNGSYQAPFPSFTYEDLGLNLKAKPTIHGNGSVSLDIDLSIRALEGTSVNGIPVISNRSYKGQVTLEDGEASVVAGYITQTEQGTRDGVPAFGQFPGLRAVTSSNQKDENRNELLVVMTPHIVRNAGQDAPSEIWLSPAR
jgi:hypothetical protein